MCTALDVLDSRFTGFKYFSLPDVVADNASSSHFVLSDDARAPDGLDFANLDMRLLVDGKVVHEAKSSAISGNPLLSLVQLVEMLHAHGEELPASTLVLTGAATPALRKKIIPIGSFIITTEVLPEALARELSPCNRQIYDSKNYLYYYRLTPDHRMLFGGRAAFFPETDQTIRKSAEILRLGMIDVYPQLNIS